MSERQDARKGNQPPDTVATADALSVPRGRVRLVGPDGRPYESASVQLRRVWRFAEEGFWRLDLETGDLEITPSLEPFVDGAHMTNAPTNDWSCTIHPDDVAPVRDRFKTLGASPGRELTVECRVRNRDGAYRWLRLRATAEQEEGRLVAYAGSAIDISDRRRSEEIFEQMVRQHALILNAAGEGICCVDERGRTTFANPAAARLLGATVPELMGRHLCRHIDACGFEDAVAEHATDCPIMDRPVGDRRLRQEARFRRSDDTAFDAEFVVSPVLAGGADQGAVIVFNDVTEKKAHERAVKDTREKMVQAEKLAALGTLVSGVGHELRTPMSYINNHLYLIQKAAERMVAETPDLKPIGEEFVRRCESSMKGITRMSTLLDDLRETYKPDDAEFRPLDVRTVVEKAAHLFRGAYEGPVQLEVQLEDTGEMPVQSGRMQQVVINLLNNAAEAMPEGGTIRLAAWRRGDHVMIEVRDDGPGMTREVQRSIFNPFFTTKRSGSGLGLYLVKQIVDRHMGRIECDSAPGRGTTFRIELSPDAGRPGPRGRAVSGIERELRASGEPPQDATVFTSTPRPSTSNATSSPGSR